MIPVFPERHVLPVEHPLVAQHADTCTPFSRCQDFEGFLEKGRRGGCRRQLLSSWSGGADRQVRSVEVDAGGDRQSAHVTRDQGLSAHQTRSMSTQECHVLHPLHADVARDHVLDGRDLTLQHLHRLC